MYLLVPLGSFYIYSALQPHWSVKRSNLRASPKDGCRTVWLILEWMSQINNGCPDYNIQIKIVKILQKLVESSKTSKGKMDKHILTYNKITGDKPS